MINYLNKRVKVIGQEVYGKVLREFYSEVLVAVDNAQELDYQLYFNISQVEIINEVDWKKYRWSS